MQLLVEKTGLSDVTEFVSHVDHARAVQFMQEASALLLAIPDVPGNEGILTGKLFEYIGSGRPIVGVGPVNGDASEILKKSRAGVMFDRENAEEIFQYMLSLVKEGGSLNAKVESREYINTFSRRVLTGELAKLVS